MLWICGCARYLQNDAVSCKGIIMRAFLIFAPLLIAGCDSEAKSLERQYEIASGAREKCIKAQEVADAWLRAEDSMRYRRWMALAESDCLVARYL